MYECLDLKGDLTRFRIFMALIKVPNISAKSTLGTLASHFMMFELRQTKEIHSVFPQSWVT